MGTKISEATLRENLKGSESLPIVDTDLPKGRTTTQILKDYCATPIGEAEGTAFDGGRGKAVEDVTDNLPQNILGASGSTMPLRYDTNETNDVKVSLVYNLINKLIGVKTTYHTSIPSATTTKAGVMSAADKQKLDGVSTEGDGTKFLSDDGTYKAIEIPDISNLATKTELETKVSGTGVTKMQVVTELPESPDANTLYIVTAAEEPA